MKEQEIIIQDFYGENSNWYSSSRIKDYSSELNKLTQS
jgi:hypothetical protein